MPARSTLATRYRRIRHATAAALTLILSQMVESAFAQGAADSAGASADALPSLTGFGRLPHNLSPWQMFVSADVVVQAVMISLALASVATWTILIAKTTELMAARRSLKSGI